MLLLRNLSNNNGIAKKPGTGSFLTPYGQPLELVKIDKKIPYPENTKTPDQGGTGVGVGFIRMQFNLIYTHNACPCTGGKENKMKNVYVNCKAIVRGGEKPAMVKLDIGWICNPMEARIAHASILSFVDAVKENAYDEDAKWIVHVHAHHDDGEKLFTFSGNDPWEYTSMAEDGDPKDYGHETALWAFLYE